MNVQYILEIVDNHDATTIGSDKGTAYYLSTRLGSILEELSDGEMVCIKKI